jgi:hypothetical protein
LISWLRAWQYGLAHHDDKCLAYTVLNWPSDNGAPIPYGENDGAIALTCWYSPNSGNVVVDYTAGGVPYSLDFTFTAGSLLDTGSAHHYQSVDVPSSLPLGAARDRLTSGAGTAGCRA